MRSHLYSFARLVCLTCACVSSFIASANAIAIDGTQGKADSLAGIFVMLYDPSTGVQYSGVGTEPLTGATSTYAAFDAILDTGASGCLLSQSDSTALGIPLISGATYSDVGIGGTETFNVSKPTELRIAPMTSSIYSVKYDPNDILNFTITDNTENPAYYSSTGRYNFQVRQQDTTASLGEGYTYTVPYNIVGTPVLNQYILHVQPSTISDYTGNVCSYKQAELLSQSAMPDLSGKSGVLRVALKYQNFVTNAGSVSTSTNPTIENVSLSLNGKTASSTFLFDTGSLITVIGKNLAEQLGITPGSDYVDSVSLSGVGTTTVTVYGYNVDSLTVPLKDGDMLTFTNTIVYTSADSALPADLTAIFGQNLLGQSYTASDSSDLVASPFSDWYVNPFTSELVLVTTDAPEPATLWLAAAAALGILFRCRIMRRSVV